MHTRSRALVRRNIVVAVVAESGLSDTVRDCVRFVGRQDVSAARRFLDSTHGDTCLENLHHQVSGACVRDLHVLQHISHDTLECGTFDEPVHLVSVLVPGHLRERVRFSSVCYWLCLRLFLTVSVLIEAR